MHAVATEHPCAYVKFHRGLRALHTELAPLPPARDLQLRPWQRILTQFLQQPADDRSIIWVVDRPGQAGKSTLSKHLVLTKGATVLEGRLADMCYSYDKQPIVIFDISRAAAEHSDHLYSMAEKLKNGIFLSTKYDSMMKVFDPPHVIFFSNSAPDTSKWSSDRCKIVDLDKAEPFPVDMLLQAGSQQQQIQPVLPDNLGSPFL